MRLVYTTCTPTRANNAKTFGDLGYRMLDAPVAGSTSVAAAGELNIMVGCDEQTFKEFEPVLAAMGEKISLMGEVGSGARMKLRFPQVRRLRVSKPLSLHWLALY